MIAIAQRSLEQGRRHLRLMTNQCQIIGVVRARQNVPLIAALLKCQVIFGDTKLITPGEGSNCMSPCVNCVSSRKNDARLPFIEVAKSNDRRPLAGLLESQSHFKRQHGGVDLSTRQSSNLTRVCLEPYRFD